LPIENTGYVTISKPDSHSAHDFSDCRSMSATVDRPFVIHLWEDRTRGEQWVPSYDTKGLALLSDEFLRIASNNAVENGQRIFEFKAVTPGTHRLVFEKRMGWKFTAEDRRVFQIDAANPLGS
jgi:predicted secreted protein